MSTEAESQGGLLEEIAEGKGNSAMEIGKQEKQNRTKQNKATEKKQKNKKK